MMAIKNILLILIVFCLLTLPARSEISYDFLKISPSPVGTSLADPIAMDMDHAAAWYYNPALLCYRIPYFTPQAAFLRKIDLYMSYSPYPGDTHYLSFYSVLDLKTIKRLGLAFQGLFYGDIPATSYNGDGYSFNERLSIAFYSLALGYGFELTEKIGMGVSLKVPIEDLGEESFVGLGGDAGLLYKQKAFSASFAVQNIGYDLTGESTHIFPLLLKLGIGYQMFLFRNTYPGQHALTLTGHVSKEIEREYAAGIGLEYSFRRILFLRSGMIYDPSQKDLDLRFGGGLMYQNLRVDYSFNSRALGDMHRIGLGSRFNFIRVSRVQQEETIKGIVIMLREDKFELFRERSSIPHPDAYRVLDQITDVLKTKKNKEVAINAYIENINTDKVNVKISRERVKFIYDYFAQNGINKNRMSYHVYGLDTFMDIYPSGEPSSTQKIEVIIYRLKKRKRDQFDQYFYNGLDEYMKGSFGKALSHWNKALKIDPENKTLLKWIEKAETEQ